MSFFQLTIPGEFEDAFIYMGRLIVVTPERDLLATDLRSMLSQSPFESVSPLMEFFFLRNDHLQDTLVRLLMSEPAVHRAIQREARKNGIVFNPEWTPPSIEQSSLGGGAVLDIQLYNRRMYVSTTEGLYDFDLDFEAQDIDVIRWRQRLDARCLSTSIKNGTAVASCGDEGLLVAVDEFDWAYVNPKHRFTQMSDASRRASWVSYSLVNYPSPSSLEFLRGQRDETLGDSGPTGDFVVTGFEHDEGALEPIRDDLENVEFVFNNGPLFFSQNNAGSYTFTRHPFNHRYKRFGPSKKPSRRGRIPDALSAHSLGTGIAVETFDSVIYVSEDATERLFDGQAVKVRTFPNSKHHKNIAIVISDDAIHILSPVPGMSSLND